MNSEKFLHLFWEFPPHIEGGLGVAGGSLCDALSKLVQVDIAHPQSCQTGVSKIDTNTRVFQIRIAGTINPHQSSPYASGEYTFSLDQQIKSFNKSVKLAHFTHYSAIHAHDWLTADAASAVQKYHDKNHTLIILHIHSTQLERAGEHSTGIIYEKEKRAMIKADKIVTVSHMTKQIIIEKYDIPPEKVMVIHNAVKPPLKARVRANHPITVLFAARMESQKSPLFATEILCQVLRRIPHAKAIIAGKGTLLESVRSVVKFKKLDHRVEVLGHVPHDKMPLIYQAADLLIMPSAAEPFGLVSLEAAQNGLAVVMSDRSGVAEILSSSPQLPLHTVNSINTWVDTVSYLLNNPASRDKLVRSQYQRLRNCSWDSAAEQLLAILKK